MKPKLLFLCQTLPYPPDSGVTIRSYHTFRQLAEGFEVHALCFYRRELVARTLEASVGRLRDIGEVEVFPIPQEHSRVRFMWDHLRSVALGRVYTRFAYDHKEFGEALDGLLAENSFSLVHMDSLDLSGYLPRLEGLPVACTHHNIESQLLERRAEAEDSTLRSLYLRHQAGLMREEERRWCPRLNLNVTVSEGDRARLTELVSGARCSVFPNGVDVERFRPIRRLGDEVVSIGGVEWFPNEDALEFFSRDILPVLRERMAITPEVRWIGRCPRSLRREYQAVGIDMTGYVDDVRPELRKGGCFVVPLRVGGGTRLKILTAWAMGLPVVSTSVGCEGLDAVEGRNILIRDEPEPFAHAVMEVLANEALRARLSRGGRETAVETYSWSKIGSIMRDEYRRLIKANVKLPSLSAI